MVQQERQFTTVVPTAHPSDSKAFDATSEHSTFRAVLKHLSSYSTIQHYSSFHFTCFNYNFVQTVALNTNSSFPTSMHSDQWISIRGSTYHIFTSLLTFPIILLITQLHQFLPLCLNGSYVLASVSGTVNISDTPILFHILYVPEFKVNLIYVPKLIHTLE